MSFKKSSRLVGVVAGLWLGGLLLSGGGTAPRAADDQLLWERLAAGQYRETVHAIFQEVEYEPGAVLAPDRLLLLAHCYYRQGKPKEAFRALQQIRLTAPDLPPAAQALDLLTNLYRSTLLAPKREEGALFTWDAAFAPLRAQRLAVTPGQLQADGAGRIYLLGPDSRRGTLTVLDRDGQRLQEFAVPGVAALALAAGASPAYLLTAAGVERLTLPAGTRDPVPVPGAAGATSLAVNRSGDLFFLLPAGPKVLVTDPQGRPIREVPLSSEGRWERLAVDSANRLFLVDTRADAVMVFGADGRPVGPVSGTGEYWMREPVDLAVDALDNLYILDREKREVLVFSHQLQPVGRILSRVGAGSFLRPEVLAVDRAGTVILYDGKARDLLRFR